MSERGSICTEYISCPACLREVGKILLADDKYLDTMQPVCATGDVYPIIAGKIGSSWAGGELEEFEQEIHHLLASAICHPLRIAILAESGEKIYTIKPNP